MIFLYLFFGSQCLWPRFGGISPTFSFDDSCLLISVHCTLRIWRQRSVRHVIGHEANVKTAKAGVEIHLADGNRQMSPFAQVHLQQLANVHHQSLRATMDACGLYTKSIKGPDKPHTSPSPDKPAKRKVKMAWETQEGENRW